MVNDGATPAPAATQDEPEETMTNPAHPYVGLWVTADDRVRHKLLPDGRYDEARGTRESAYCGRYAVTGSHIDYWDDTGFTADGDFVDADTLHHGGMVLRRVRGAKVRARKCSIQPPSEQTPQKSAILCRSRADRPGTVLYSPGLLPLLLRRGPSN